MIAPEAQFAAASQWLDFPFGKSAMWLQFASKLEFYALQAARASVYWGRRYSSPFCMK